MGEQPGNTKQNVIPFPRSRRERQKILRESEDVRVRTVATLRMACGWLLVVSTAVFLVTNYTLLEPASLRRIADYAVSGFLKREGEVSTIEYGNETFADGALFNGGLAYADSDSLFIQKPGAEPSMRYALGYSSPVVEAGGEYVLTYDRGGTRAAITNTEKAVAELTLSSPILNGSLADDGHFVLVTAEQGYRTAAAVFDTRGREVLKYNSSEYYIVTASLSPDGKTLAVLGFRQDGVELISRILLLAMSDGERLAELDLPDSLGMELCFLSDSIVAALCDDGLYLVRNRNAPERILHISSDDLLAFTAQNHALVLAVRSYDGKARSALYAMREDGRLEGPFATDDEPSAVAIANVGIAALSASGVSLYDTAFRLLWQNPDAVGARRILLTNEGQVFALYARRASVFSARSTGSQAPASAALAGQALLSLKGK